MTPRALLKSFKPLRRKKPLRYRSQKKRMEDIARRAVMAQVAKRSGGRCEVTGCTRKADHGHELLRRSQGGSPLDVGNILHVCAEHHREIHDAPKRAVELGLLKRKWGSK